MHLFYRETYSFFPPMLFVLEAKCLITYGDTVQLTHIHYSWALGISIFFILFATLYIHPLTQEIWNKILIQTHCMGQYAN